MCLISGKGKLIRFQTDFPTTSKTKQNTTTKKTQHNSSQDSERLRRGTHTGGNSRELRAQWSKKSILATNVAETGKREHKSSERSHTIQSHTYSQMHKGTSWKNSLQITKQFKKRLEEKKKPDCLTNAFSNVADDTCRSRCWSWAAEQSYAVPRGFTRHAAHALSSSNSSRIAAFSIDAWARSGRGGWAEPPAWPRVRPLIRPSTFDHHFPCTPGSVTESCPSCLPASASQVVLYISLGLLDRRGCGRDAPNKVAGHCCLQQRSVTLRYGHLKFRTLSLSWPRPEASLHCCKT